MCTNNTLLWEFKIIKGIIRVKNATLIKTLRKFHFKFLKTINPKLSTFTMLISLSKKIFAGYNKFVIKNPTVGMSLTSGNRQKTLIWIIQAF